MYVKVIENEQPSSPPPSPQKQKEQEELEYEKKRRKKKKNNNNNKKKKKKKQEKEEEKKKKKKEEQKKNKSFLPDSFLLKPCLSVTSESAHLYPHTVTHQHHLVQLWGLRDVPLAQNDDSACGVQATPTCLRVGEEAEGAEGAGGARDGEKEEEDEEEQQQEEEEKEEEEAGEGGGEEEEGRRKSRRRTSPFSLILSTQTLSLSNQRKHWSLPTHPHSPASSCAALRSQGRPPCTEWWQCLWRPGHTYLPKSWRRSRRSRRSWRRRKRGGRRTTTTRRRRRKRRRRSRRRRRRRRRRKKVEQKNKFFLPDSFLLKPCLSVTSTSTDLYPHTLTHQHHLVQLWGLRDVPLAQNDDSARGVQATPTCPPRHLNVLSRQQVA